MQHFDKLINITIGAKYNAELYNSIEDIVRNDIFHSTLDWQTQAQLTAAIRQALTYLLDVEYLFEDNPIADQIRTARPHELTNIRKSLGADITHDGDHYVVDLDGTKGFGVTPHHAMLELCERMDAGCGEYQAERCHEIESVGTYLEQMSLYKIPPDNPAASLFDCPIDSAVGDACRALIRAACDLESSCHDTNDSPIRWDEIATQCAIYFTA